MPKFNVRVERQYRARHWTTVEDIEADTAEEAQEIVRKMLDEDQIDPSELDYVNEGYCEPWAVEDATAIEDNKETDTNG